MACIDWFIPDVLCSQGHAEHLRARLLVVMFVLLMLTAVGYSFLYYLIGSMWSVVALMTGALLGIVCLFSMRWTGSQKIAAHGVVWIPQGTLTIQAFAVGGVSGPSALWFLFTPLIATTVLGRKVALIYTGLTFVVMTGLLGLEYNGYVFANDVAHMESFWTYKSIFGLMCAILITLSFYESMNERVARRLSQEKDRAQQYLDIAGTVFIGINSDQRVFLANRKACEVLQCSEHNICEMNWFDHFVPADDREQARNVFKALMSGDVVPVEYFENRIFTSNGDERLMAWHNTVICDDDGKVKAALSSGEDITERRRAETELRDQAAKLKALNMELVAQSEQLKAQQIEVRSANEQLREANRIAEQANQAKSDFLANMSHEIRTPMTAIMGFADTILELVDDDNPEIVDAANTIKRNGDHLLVVINDILDLSKIEAGKNVVETSECVLCDIVRDVVMLLRPYAEERGLDFVVRNTTPLPDRITTDPIRVRQVLINLLSNAIKFAEKGAVELMIAADMEAHEPQIHFDIIDHGIGMTREQVERLFQPFEQADSSTSRKYGGTGLGLTISRRLANLLGGDVILVDSQPGKGTHFRASIAAGSRCSHIMIEQPDFSVRPSTASASRSRNPVTRRLRGCRILVAEDGPDNQRLIAHILTKAGAEMTIVDNGQQAIAAAMSADEENKPFDVVLMDMQMPVMDGYQATKALRREGYHLPIIALTAHAMHNDRDRCIEAGCNDYVSKPINRKRLIDVIVKSLPNPELCAAQSNPD